MTIQDTLETSNNYYRLIEKLAPMSLALTVFFIPMGTGLMNILYGLSIFLGLLLFLHKSIAHQFIQRIKEPVFYWSITFFGLLGVVGFFGSYDLAPHIYALGKYTPFLLLPFLGTIFGIDKCSKYALIGFHFSMAMILILSYAIYLGFDVKGVFAHLNINITGDSANPTVFRLHITQNFFMGIAVCIWAYLAIQVHNQGCKIFYGVLALAGLINVLFLVQGRTGYLVIFTVLVYALIRRLKISYFLIAAITLLILIFALYQFAPTFHERIHLGIQEVQQWQPGAGSNTSMGLRLDFWDTSLKLIQKAPLLGHGLGSFENSYLEQVKNTSIVPSVNPHNQYLLFAVELGLLGLFAYLTLNYVFWMCSKRLNPFWRMWAQVIILSYAVGNVFNSFLIDSAERMFFALSLALAFSHLPFEKNKSRTTLS